MLKEDKTNEKKKNFFFFFQQPRKSILKFKCRMCRFAFMTYKISKDGNIYLEDYCHYHKHIKVEDKIMKKQFKNE